MITKVIAHNFQSHAHTEVELGKGLTVFVGDSDQGKTSLVKRALLWCLFNEPSGNSMVRYKDNGKTNANGERERESLCYVTLEFDYGQYILTRQREKNKNTYTLINEDGEILSFEGFRDIVPTEIQDALGIKKFKIDEDLKFNINIIGSRDPSIVDLSGSVKSKVIGAFAGTNIVDIANRGVVADQKSLSVSLKSFEKESENLKKECEHFSNIEEREKILNSIESQMHEADNLFSRQEKVFSYLKKVSENAMAEKAAKEIVALEDSVSREQDLIFETEDVISDTTVLVEKHNKVSSCLKKIIENKVQSEKAQKVLHQEKNVQKEEDIISNVSNEIEALKELLVKKQKINEILIRLKNNQKYFDNAKKIIDSETMLFGYESRTNDILSAVEELQYFMKVAKENFSKVTSAFKHYWDVEQTINATKKHIAEEENALQVDIDNYVAEVKSMGTCPLCKHKISAKELENIKNEF